MEQKQDKLKEIISHAKEYGFVFPSSEIYDGLYFVGAGTHPGAGVPGVLSSEKVLDKIL